MGMRYSLMSMVGVGPTQWAVGVVEVVISRLKGLKEVDVP